jgi:hypothetical protein
MPSHLLTARRIQGVSTPETGQVEYFVTKIPGLALRVTRNGVKRGTTHMCCPCMCPDHVSSSRNDSASWALRRVGTPGSLDTLILRDKMPEVTPATTMRWHCLAAGGATALWGVQAAIGSTAQCRHMDSVSAAVYCVGYDKGGEGRALETGW